MSKMVLIDIAQRSDEWLLWRSQGITATDIPIIFGLSPYKTPWQLWAEKVRRTNSPDISRNPNVIRGNKLEDQARIVAEAQQVELIRDMFKETESEILLPICGECGDYRILRASLDGIDSIDAPVELKAPSKTVYNEIVKNGTASETYKLYEMQALAQCVVTGSGTGRLVFYLDKKTYQIFHITLTPEKRKEILRAAKEFWMLVQTNTPPETDPERDWFIPDSENEMFKWQSLTDVWRQYNHELETLKAEMTKLDDMKKNIQSSLVGMMGPFLKADLGGVKITKFSKKGSVDYGKFLVDYGTFLTDHLPDKDISNTLDRYRKSSKNEVRFTKSEDELVNLTVDEVISDVKKGYF